MPLDTLTAECIQVGQDAKLAVYGEVSIAAVFPAAFGNKNDQRAFAIVEAIKNAQRAKGSA